MKLPKQPKPKSFIKRPVGMHRRKPLLKPKLKKAPLKIYSCNGGPFAGREVLLTSGGTLPFVLNGMKGHYDRNMQWKESQ